MQYFTYLKKKISVTYIRIELSLGEIQKKDYFYARKKKEKKKETKHKKQIITFYSANNFLITFKYLFLQIGLSLPAEKSYFTLNISKCH